MRKNNKQVTTNFILLSLLLIAVVYAILQANLQINGTAKIKANTWDIHFNNIQVNENSVSIGTGDSPATIDPNNNCKVDFEVTLGVPGDFYEFTIDVVNAGTIDGMIGTINKTLIVNNEPVDTPPDYLNFSVTYSDGDELLEEHKIEAGSSETYKVRLEFKTDIEELPSATTISTSLEPQYLQADSSAIKRLGGTFIDGKSFNARIKQLAGDSEATYETSNTNITAIRRSTVAPDMNSMSNDNLVSIDNKEPIFVCFENNTIYYYSDSNKVFFNSDASYMFYNLRRVSTIEVSAIDCSKTTNMSYMFMYLGISSGAAFNLDLSNWNTSEVTNLSHMFDCVGYFATTWNLNISKWDTSKVTNMSFVFYQAGQNSTTFSLDISKWDTSNVTNMTDLFASAGMSATTWSVGDLSKWDTSKVTSMISLFDRTGQKATTWSVGDLSKWDTSKVTSMASMFSGAAQKATIFSLNISKWDTSQVTDMDSMFSFTASNSTVFNVDLSKWNTSNVTKMLHMFNSSGRYATTWSVGDLSKWDTSKVTNMSNMFLNAGQNATTWNDIGILKIHNAGISSMFKDCKNAKATLKFYNNISYYSSAFSGAATTTGSGITVDYTSAVAANIDNIIATKSDDSNIIKGNLFTA